MRLLMVFVTGLLTGEPALAGTIVGQVHRAGSAANLSNFVIWVDDIRGSLPAPTGLAMLNQKGLLFIPHVLAIQVGTTVEFANADPVSHNVFSISEAKRFNLGMFRHDVIRRLTFDTPGVIELLCNVHLEMDAYIVVVKNPYFVLTVAGGTYRISGVPAGRHRLRCWHEGLLDQERVVDVPEDGSVIVNFLVQS